MPMIPTAPRRPPSTSPKIRNPNSSLALPALVLLLSIAFAWPGFAQEPTQKYFRIGYMRGDPETPLGDAVFARLKDFLVARDGVTSAMADNGIDDIIVQSSDSHQGLIDWMDQDQLDLAFCTSVDFVKKKGNYEPIFQLQRPRDTYDPRGNRIFHRGEIFANNRSQYFHGSSNKTLGEMLAGKPVAMVDTFSASGYYYPMLKIADSTTATQPCQPIFCGSSEEVVKSVINGVTEFGACDQGVIDEVLERNGLLSKKDTLVKVLALTDPIPTDPVAINERWLPQQSELGRQIKEGVYQFFVENHLPALKPSSRRAYDDIDQNLRQWKAQGHGRTAGRP